MVVPREHGEHKWESEAYVADWIARDVTRDDMRRPLLRRAVNLLPFASNASIRILDVGAGYGALTQQALEQFPHAEIVYHDFSAPMLAAARTRLAWAGDRVTYVASDLHVPQWTAALPAPFDAVVSAIAIHNLRNPQRIREIYREIEDLVRPGGAFIQYELVFPQGRLTRAAYERDRGAGQPDVAAHQVRQSDPPAAQAQRATAAPAGLGLQLRWLEEAGFDEVDCFWKDGITAIFGGFK